LNLDALKRAENSKALDYAVEASLGPNHRRTQRAAQRRRDEYISEIQDRLENGEINIRTYLQKARNLTDPDLSYKKVKALYK